MNESTEGVTLFASFLLDVAAIYRDLGAIAAPLRELTAGLDPRYPLEPVAMSQYNALCTWIEETFGELSIRDAGRRLGEGSFKRIQERAGRTAFRPSDVLRELTRSARLSIQDPQGRGWELLVDEPRHIRMRRTQTFNCLLQEGLLASLVEKTRVLRPKVSQETCTRRGDEFCEYDITWLADAR